MIKIECSGCGATVLPDIGDPRRAARASTTIVSPVECPSCGRRLGTLEWDQRP